jgi:hypothetical protein
VVVRGRVEKGVVVLDEGVHLPEGQEVSVLAPDSDRAGGPASHSILDVPPASVGIVLRPLTSDDDVLGEMLDEQP